MLLQPPAKIPWSPRILGQHHDLLRISQSLTEVLYFLGILGLYDDRDLAGLHLVAQVFQGELGKKDRNMALSGPFAPNPPKGTILRVANAVTF